MSSESTSSLTWWLDSFHGTQGDPVSSGERQLLPFIGHAVILLSALVGDHRAQHPQTNGIRQTRTPGSGDRKEASLERDEERLEHTPCCSFLFLPRAALSGKKKRSGRGLYVCVAFHATLFGCQPRGHASQGCLENTYPLKHHLQFCRSVLYLHCMRVSLCVSVLLREFCISVVISQCSLDANTRF